MGVSGFKRIRYSNKIKKTAEWRGVTSYIRLFLISSFTFKVTILQWNQLSFVLNFINQPNDQEEGETDIGNECAVPIDVTARKGLEVLVGNDKDT